MLLSFNKHGDIKTSGSNISKVTSIESQLGRFMFYAAVNKNSYVYDPLFGNSVYTIMGKTKTENNLKVLRKVLEDDIMKSDIFLDIATTVSVMSLSKHRVGINIIGTGLNANWEILASSRGIELKGFVDGTLPASATQNIICEKIINTIDGALSYDITTLYQDCMNKNDVNTLGDAEFEIRVSYQAPNTTEPRIMRKDEYNISEGLTDRVLVFYRALAADGTLTVQAWPRESVVESTSNPYLLRKNRTSTPTTRTNTY